MINDKQLISKLMASNLIDQKVLRQGLALAKRQEKTLYEALTLSRLVDEQVLVEVASNILNVPSVRLTEVKIDETTAQMVSSEMATKTKTIPLELIDDAGVQVLRLAMSDPIDVMAMDEVASHTGVNIQPLLAGPADIAAAIERIYGVEEPAIALEEVVSEVELIELDDELLELDDIIDDAIINWGDDGESEELEYDDLDVDAGIFAQDDFDFSADEEIYSGADVDPGSDDLLVEELVDGDPVETETPTSLEQDEDSWALMFDESGKAVDINSSQSGGEAVSLPPHLERMDASKTQIGSPAQIGRLANNDALSEEPEADPDGIDDDGDEIQTASAVESEPWEIEEIDDDSTPDEAADEPQPQEDEAQDDEAQEVHEEKEPQKREAENKRVVPSNIRDLLNKKQNKSDESSDDGDESSDTPSALGRIEVKKVAVPASSFKGVIEKRSDLDKEPGNDSLPIESRTREMPGGKLADLARKSTDKEESPTVKLPDDVDSHRLLKGLIELLIDRKVVSAEEINTLVEEME